MISIALFAISVICAVNGDGGKMNELAHSTVLDGQGKFHLAWAFNFSHIMFEVQVETRGWVGFGFSTNGGMYGADIVMGWVEENTGKTVFQDRHATKRSEPMIDTNQNYTLLGSFQNDTFTILRFIRPLNLECETQDFNITGDTIRVIWAYNDMKPAAGTGPVYHGANRGVRSIILLNPIDSRPPMPANILTFDILHRNVTIPGHKDTTYWCRSFEIPKLDRKHHIIKVEPVIQPGREAEVHHIVVMACQHKDKTSVGLDHECYHPNMPAEWAVCATPLVAWAVGGGDFYLPDHVGLPLGDNALDTPTMFLLSVHYDNPRLQYGMVDSSGLRITLTPDLRQYDSAMLTLGVQVWETQVIPPHYADFVSEALCTNGCLSQGMGNQTDEINLVSVILHTHLAGRKIRLRHFRGGVEHEPIMEENNYDFNLQETRLLTNERIIRKGDHTVLQCHYNTENRTNLTVGGLGTKQEMCTAFVMYYPKIPLSLCVSVPTAQYHVAFVGATLNDDRILSPEEHRGEDWKTFLQREVDWRSEMERKRFKKYSLKKNIPIHYHMCFAGAVPYLSTSFRTVSMPSVDFPWTEKHKVCLLSSANQNPFSSVVLSSMTALTSLIIYNQWF